MSTPLLDFAIRERVTPPFVARTRGEKFRLFSIFLICFLINFILVFAFFFEVAFDPQNSAPQETPVEVVALAKPEPEPQQKENSEPNPPSPPAGLDEKPADSAPRVASNKGEKKDPDRPSESEQKAANKQKTDTPAAHALKTSKPPTEEKPDEARSAQDRQAQERPDAETIENAGEKDSEKTLNQTPKSQHDLAEREKTAQEPPSPQTDAKNDPAPKESPIDGGNFETTYSSILQGLIMRQMHQPVMKEDPPSPVVVEVQVSADGSIISARVKDSSGAPALDAAALDAVRRAGPFPHTPYFAPLAFVFTYWRPARSEPYRNPL